MCTLWLKNNHAEQLLNFLKLRSMKQSFLLFILCTFLWSTLGTAMPTKPHTAKEEIISVKAAKKEAKAQKKLEKKEAKLEKQLKKIEKKLVKKGIHKTEARSVWDDETFKLGALVALGGLLLTILGALPILGGIFALIGGLMLIVGIGLMIWVLIESY